MVRMFLISCEVHSNVYVYVIRKFEQTVSLKFSEAT